MADSARTGLHDLLASRKAEEAAWRRFQGAAWLDGLVGPLGMSSHPSERELISHLRNGLILCNAINKVQPGAVPKVVESPSPLWSVTREFQPLPAYQYFENVRNFLVAIEELKLPAFEASDLERDTMEAGSAAKVVDCILALKSYHECKQMNGGNGFYKPIRSPMNMLPNSRNDCASNSSDSCRQLDMSVASEKQPLPSAGIQKLEDLMVKLLADSMANSKENIDGNLLMAFHNGNMDLVKLLSKVISSCLEDKHHKKFPELKSMLEEFQRESGRSPVHSTMPSQSKLGCFPYCQGCLGDGNCTHRRLLQMQEKELLDLKVLLTSTKKEFEDLQSQFRRDLKTLGIQVEDMSSAALGYHRVLKENRNLYNMVQDLKGNIRVYCRIRPAFGPKASNIIDFVGEDGSLVISEPLQSQKDGKKFFQFNRVFGPTATQDDVFEDTQPLIRSVMDGYNVCIFAYGQTGSGKTYTMSGPSGGLTKDMGINYLALNYLFRMSEERKDIMNYDIQVQMVEIYNEQVRDLLVEDSSASKLEIRSCIGENGLSLPDAKMHSVKSTIDVLNLMKLGEVNRVVCCTAMNNRSSRSHSVLTIHVHAKDVSGSTLRSCLHLVDLAGSERVDKSEVAGDRLKEAQHINKSLSSLGDVITALAQKNSHIPYRNSKLTLLLQDSLGGHAKTLMFAHVSPEGDSYGETLSTLKFAQRVSTVDLGAARANKQSSEIVQLKERVENLKKALASKETQNAQIKLLKGPGSLCENPKAITEQTPPRGRRLSIENGSSMKSKTQKIMNFDERKRSKTPPLPSRPQRLSLEGPGYGKKDNQTKLPVDLSKPLDFEAVTMQQFGHSQDVERATKPYGHSANGSSMMEVYHLNASRSPRSSHQKHFVKKDCRTLISHLQPLTTPEPKVSARNEVQISVQSKLTLSTDSPNLVSSANGKGSQMRKSLRNIGKLINGSEKRNQQRFRVEELSINRSSNNTEPKSPLTANARASRRQSLTGIQPLGSERSRRSSLGGKPTDNDGTRRNKSPPSVVHSSMKTTKRWV